MFTLELGRQSRKTRELPICIAYFSAQSEMGVFVPSQLFLLVLSTFLFIVNNSISILLKTSNTELEIIGFQFKEINSRNRRLANKAIFDKKK